MNSFKSAPQRVRAHVPEECECPSNDQRRRADCGLGGKRYGGPDHGEARSDRVHKSATFRDVKEAPARPYDAKSSATASSQRGTCKSSFEETAASTPWDAGGICRTSAACKVTPKP